MAMASLDLLPLSVAAVFCLFLILLRTFRRHYSHIPGPPSESWLTGNLNQLFDPNGWAFHEYLSKTFGSVVKVHSLFNTEVLYVSDPLALHHIIIKQHDVFEEGEVFLHTNHLVFGESLLSIIGDAHRKQRKMLNPLFSMKHMREILPVFYPITHEMRDNIIADVKNGQEEINMMKWMGRAALEYIGRGGLGHTFGPLDDEGSRVFDDAMKKISPLLLRTGILRLLLPFLSSIRVGTPALHRKILDMLPFPDAKSLALSSDILFKESMKIIKEKKDALAKGDDGAQHLVSNGKDIMSVLLRENMQAKGADKLSDAALFGTVSTFIFAGQDTTSHALCRILDQLAKNPDAQSRLRDEVIQARVEHDGREFEYDALMNLPYLDAICRETLRVFSPANFVERGARSDTIVPLMFPILAKDGKSEIREIKVKKGTNILVSMFGANRDKKIWGEDAEEWKPERWLKGLPKSVSDAHLPGVYSSIMTFLGGSRACIGFKFSEMEMKLVLSSLIEKLSFAPGPPITWEMSPIVRPIRPETGSIDTQLPLKVTLVA